MSGLFVAFEGLGTRFTSKVVESPSGCWEWIAGKNHAGYGLYRHKGVCRLAHRVAWQQTKGPILGGLHVLHRCDNPACVNPDHLFLGTNFDNVADRVAKNRTARLRGKDSPRNAKILTAQEVAELREKYATGTFSQVELAHAYGVSTTAVSRAIRGRTWAIPEAGIPTTQFCGVQSGSRHWTQRNKR